MVTAVDDRPSFDFRRLFEPEVVVVAGASAREERGGNHFIRQLRDFGYAGALYALHPAATEIDGVPAVRAIRDIPVPVDYAYLTVPAAAIPGILREAGDRLGFAQIVSSGLGDGEGSVLAEVRDVIRTTGTRVLGPNSLGTYSPRGGLTFVDGAPREPGGVGIVSQSGGLSLDIIRQGGAMGLRFSAVVSLGNSVDIGPAELLGQFLDDPRTKVVGMYLEDLRDGRDFIEALRRRPGHKPVVVLKGGSTGAGMRAASSHTGAAASDYRVWRGLARQFGLRLVDSLEHLLNTLVVRDRYPQALDPAGRILVFGNGGGAGVLLSDALARRDLAVQPTSAGTVAACDALGLPPGTDVRNPIDTPAGTLAVEEGALAARLLDLVLRREAPDVLLLHLNLAVTRQGGMYERGMRGFLAAAIPALAAARERTAAVLVLRSDRSPEVDALRRELVETARLAGLPVVDDFDSAALAMASR